MAKMHKYAPLPPIDFINIIGSDLRRLPEATQLQLTRRRMPPAYHRSASLPIEVLDILLPSRRQFLVL
jgi:hypothetical protein